jgi:Kef-type K+ transport system membrane component KefB
MEVFLEISLILLAALCVSTILRALKQPLIIGYIITGLLVGPSGLNILASTEIVELFSKIGITSLLFIVGLGLSPKVIKDLGIVSLVTGFGQVIITSVVGVLIALVLGFSTSEAIYIAIALTFSSTIIILKLLSDKGDLNKLYGRIAIGFLLVQDLIATIILVIVSSSATISSGQNIFIELSLILLKGLIVLSALMFIASTVFKKIHNFVGSSQEYLFIFGLTWGLAIASLYHFLGLSIEIGALVAGVTLSMSPFSLELSSKLKPLRDFFIILFFIFLGYHMSFDNWQNLIIPTLLFSLYILVGNPIIMHILMNLMGYTRKVGFMAGLTVAQISEFSLILITLAYSVGHLSKEVVSIITLVGIITIAGSTYLILYSEAIYKRVGHLLKYIEFKKITKRRKENNHNYDALILGYKRAGPEFAEIFAEKKYSFLVIDLDPSVVEKLKEKNLHVDYGDISDLEFLSELPLSNIKLAVSTISDFEANMLFLKTTRRVNPSAVIIIIADTADHSLSLYEAGATHVVLAHYVGAHYAANMILQKGYDSSKYEEMRQRQIKHLKNSSHFKI